MQLKWLATDVGIFWTYCLSFAPTPCRASWDQNGFPFAAVDSLGEKSPGLRDCDPAATLYKIMVGPSLGPISVWGSPFKSWLRAMSEMSLVGSRSCWDTSPTQEHRIVYPK